MESNCTNPIKTGHFCASCDREMGGGGGFAVLPPVLPCNFETTHGNVTKITQNVIFIILKLLAQ